MNAFPFQIDNRGVALSIVEVNESLPPRVKNNIRMAVEETGIIKVVEAVGIKSIVEAIGVERIVETVGVEKMRDKIGLE
ncbi:MAG: hypothetical protein ACTSXP_07220 [Promethearchaeota archaeon]